MVPIKSARDKELHEQIADGVAALVDSDAWRAMLDTAAKFHTYSLGNVLLIALQAPTASRVAGFRTWKSLGRQVRKDERGIAVLAPCTYRPKTSTAATAATDSTREQAKDERGGQAAPATGGEHLRGFRVVHVFDIAQIEGDPLPDVAPALLTGTGSGRPVGRPGRPGERARLHPRARRLLRRQRPHRPRPPRGAGP